MGLFGKKRKLIPLYVGCNGNDFTRGVYVFQLDIENGEIFKKKYFKSFSNPVSFYKRDRFLYLCYANNTGKATDGGLWQYATMELQFGLAARISHHGKTFVSSFVNEDRSYAYAVDYYNGEVVTIPVIKQKIVRVSQCIKHEGSGPVPKRQESAHPHFIEETPDHQKLFVCDVGIDKVVLYNVLEKGRLEADEENTIILEPGSGPRKMIFSPNGHFAYILNEFSNTICVYSYKDGHFDFIQKIPSFNLQEQIEESFAGDFIFNEEGDYLFVSNRGQDVISVFEVDQDKGTLSLIEEVDTDEGPSSLVIVQNRWLVVASKKGGSLESFEIKRGESKGLLYETHFSYVIEEPTCLIEGRS